VALSLILLGPAESGWADPTNNVPPKTLADLDRYYAAVPAQSNAALVILKGIEVMNITDSDFRSTLLPWVGRGSLPALGTEVSTKMNVAMGEMERRHASALGYFVAAAALPASRYPFNLADDPEQRLLHLTGLRQASNLLALSSLWRATSGRPVPAAEALLANFGLVSSLESEPLLVSRLTSSSVAERGTQALEQLLNRVSLPEPSLAGLRSALDHLAASYMSGTNFLRGLDGQRVFCRSIFEEPPQKRDALILQAFYNSQRTPEQWKPEAAELGSQEDITFTLRLFDKVAALWDSQPPAGPSAALEFCNRAAEDAKTNRFAFGFSEAHFVADTLAGELRALANLQAARIAVALEQFRAAHDNSYPAALTALDDSTKGMSPSGQDHRGLTITYVKVGRGYETRIVFPESLPAVGTENKSNVVFKVLSPPAR
jgi:hypothetical protein